MKLQSITSKTNPKFKDWKELDSSKGIKKQQAFFLMGEKLIAEFLRGKDSSPYKIQAEIISESMQPLQGANTHSVFSMPQSLFNELDVLGTHFNLLLLGLPVLEPAQLDQPPHFAEIIAPLGDPSNLGALIRSAAGFGIKKIILTTEACNPFHPKCVKASSGAVLNVEFFKGPSLQQIEQGADCIALDMNGTDLNQFEWPKNFRLLVGEEGPGLPEIKNIRKIKIPTENIESLNATVATSIALYDYWAKKQNKG